MLIHAPSRISIGHPIIQTCSPLARLTPTYIYGIYDVQGMIYGQQILLLHGMVRGSRMDRKSTWDIGLSVDLIIAATTQVKYNRKSEYLLASAHDKDVKIWDIRVRMDD